MKCAVIGGGAAGFFCAIALAEENKNAEVTIFESGNQFLRKVKISGGGRCNVTHACFDPRELVKKYPRGQKELMGAFTLQQKIQLNGSGIGECKPKLKKTEECFQFLINLKA